MRSAYLALACSFTFSSFFLIEALSEGTEVRQFTDVKGRQINAEVLGVQNGNVSLAVGKAQYSVPLSELSKDDQKYIQGWLENERARLPREVEIECGKKRTGREKIDNPGMEVIKEEWIFEISLSSGNSDPLNDLKLECLVYHWDAQIGGDEKTLRKRSSLIEIASIEGGNKQTRVTTEPITIVETNSASGYADGSSSKKKDELEGIWVRLYQGERILGEYKTESAALKDEKWSDD